MCKQIPTQVAVNVCSGSGKYPWQMTKDEFRDYYFSGMSYTMKTSTLRSTQFLTDESSPQVRRRNAQYGTSSRSCTEIADLKESVRKYGIKSPVSLYVSSKGEIGISDGTHRVLVASELELPEVSVEMTPSMVDDNGHLKIVRYMQNCGYPIPDRVLAEYDNELM